VSRPTPKLPDAALLGPRPFGDPALARILRAAPLCVAVSGGADSVALLHALVRLRAWLGGRPPYGLVAAHFHHGIRGAEADADAAFVADLCGSLGVPLRIGRGDVPAEAARTGESEEMAARRLRHDFLRAVCAGDSVARSHGRTVERPNRRAPEHSAFSIQHSALILATGHTLDDQAELFFLRLKRGASARGLSGMRPFDPASGASPARLRPLLRVRHAALADWLRAEGLAWREDATNAEDDADRNRIRHRVVPAVLDAFGPAFLSTLARSMDLLRDDADLLDALARTPVATGGSIQHSEFSIQHSAFSIQHSPPLLRRRIAAALYAAGVDPEAVTLDAIERLRRLLEAHRGGAVPLGRGVAARVKRGAILVERAAPRRRSAK